MGGGIGAIEIELFKAGMARAVNVELTPTYEATARELLVDDVEAADVVVMNRVICCYPDMPKLAGAAADRARGMLVRAFPTAAGEPDLV